MDAETYAPYLLRDALLLGAVGGALFALNAGGWLPPSVLRRPRGLLRAGWTLLLTGLAVTLGGGLGLALGLEGVAGLAAALAWGLGIVLQLAGAWWPGVASDYAPPLTRWGRDAAGNIVALEGRAGEAGAGRRSSPTAPGSLGVRYAPLWLLAVLLLAAGLRFWDLAGLPPTCIGQECAIALQLQQNAAPHEGGERENGTSTGATGASEPGEAGLAAPAGLALQLRLAAPLVRWTQDALLGLRRAGALIGVLTVLFTALALRRLVAPLPALLGAALLAISPWHLWAGRTTDPSLTAACLVALALWLGLEAIERGHARWWLPFGLAVGLLAAQTPALAPSAALWALGAAGLGLAQAHARRGRVGAAARWRWPLCALAAAAGAALGAYLGAAPPDWLGWIVPAAANGSGANSAGLLGALLRPDTLPTGASAPLPGGLLGSFGFALALGGLGVLLRHLRQPAAAFVLLGSAALLGAALLATPLLAAPGMADAAVAPSLLPLLPLLIALMALALDRLLGALGAAWGPPLLRTAVVLGSAVLAVLLLAGRGTVTLLAGLDSVRGGAGATVEAGMARYIAVQLAAPDGQNITFVAPPAALDDPSLRLLAGAALEAGRVTGLELGRTLPYAQTPAGDVVYLLPLLDTQVIDLLQRLYPGGVAEIELDAAGTAALFQRFRVRQADLLRAQALEMIVTPADAAMDAPPGVEAQDTAVTGVTEYVSALGFAWGATPPLPPPFRAQWRGLLIAPESGAYTFAVENAAPESTFTLTVDDILLLDSSLGLTTQQTPLPRGIHRLHIDYRSGGQPGDLRVTWQAPGPAGEAAGAQVMAAPLLLSPTIPDQGLLGDYYGNERFEGPPVAEHKDPVIGLDPSLPLPYSVIWHGLLAAPRAGDYLIGVDAPGAAQVTVNGVLLADNRAPAAPQFDLSAEAASSYSEGLIYLPAGWQRIEVRYVAGAEPPSAGAPERLRLLWQPPGGDPSELASRFLLPAYGLIGPADVPLPTLPPVTDPLLGDDHFALARPATAGSASVRVPPASLPPLALERVGQAGGVCGSGADQLNAPHGAAFGAGGSRLYVADTGNRRIQVFDGAGLPLESIASDLFQEPVAVALAPSGDLLVLDALAQQIFRVTGATAGGEVTALPLQASFYRPRGLAVDAAGNLAVADTGGGRVVLLSPDGAPQREFGGQGSPLSRGQPVDVLAIGVLLPADGQPTVVDARGVGPALWAISAEDGRLWNLPVDGSLTAVQPSGTVDGPRLGRLSDGRLLASDPARASFTLFSPAGEPLAQFGYVGELQLPTGLAAAPGAEGEFIAVVDTRACAVTLWRLGE